MPKAREEQGEHHAEQAQTDANPELDFARVSLSRKNLLHFVMGRAVGIGSQQEEQFLEFPGKREKSNHLCEREAKGGARQTQTRPEDFRA